MSFVYQNLNLDLPGCTLVNDFGEYYLYKDCDITEGYHNSALYKEMEFCRRAEGCGWIPSNPLHEERFDTVLIHSVWKVAVLVQIKTVSWDDKRKRFCIDPRCVEGGRKRKYSAEEIHALAGWCPFMIRDGDSFMRPFFILPTNVLSEYGRRITLPLHLDQNSISTRIDKLNNCFEDWASLEQIAFDIAKQNTVHTFKS